MLELGLEMALISILYLEPGLEVGRISMSRNEFGVRINFTVLCRIILQELRRYDKRPVRSCSD